MDFPSLRIEPRSTRSSWCFESPFFEREASALRNTEGTEVGFVAYVSMIEIEGDVMAKFLLWCILLVLCWPLALLALVAYPFVWLLLLPFRILGIAVGGVLELVSAIIFLPVRMVRAI